MEARGSPPQPSLSKREEGEAWLNMRDDESSKARPDIPLTVGKVGLDENNRPKYRQVSTTRSIYVIVHLLEYTKKFYLGFLWWHRRYRGHQSFAAGAEASHQAQRQCQRRNNMSRLWGGSTRERQTSFALWWYLLLLLSSLLSSVTSGDQDAQF